MADFQKAKNMIYFKVEQRGSKTEMFLSFSYFTAKAGIDYETSIDH
jgi:hypothetical protein